MIDLSVDVGGLVLQNPVMTASGTFGYAEEFEAFMDLEALGAVITKTITLEERAGNPPPRLVETAGGLLNSIGLMNVGAQRFIDEKLPYLAGLKKARVVLNVAGKSVDEFARLVELLEPQSGFHAFELNISCPNVDDGLEMGSSPERTRQVTEAAVLLTKRPVIVKLTPNVTHIDEIALAAQEGGASAVSLINTIVGMSVDIRTRRSRLARDMGGLSGPAIKPIALARVHVVAGRVSIPVIGIGGIMTWEDAVEFMLVGACAIQVGTANFRDPAAAARIIQGIELYLHKSDAQRARDIVGKFESK